MLIDAFSYIFYDLMMHHKRCGAKTVIEQTTGLLLFWLSWWFLPIMLCQLCCSGENPVVMTLEGCTSVFIKFNSANYFARWIHTSVHAISDKMEGTQRVVE